MVISKIINVPYGYYFTAASRGFRCYCTQLVSKEYCVVVVMSLSCRCGVVVLSVRAGEGCHLWTTVYVPPYICHHHHHLLFNRVISNRREMKVKTMRGLHFAVMPNTHRRRRRSAGLTHKRTKRVLRAPSYKGAPSKTGRKLSKPNYTFQRVQI